MRRRLSVALPLLLIASVLGAPVRAAGPGPSGDAFLSEGEHGAQPAVETASSPIEGFTDSVVLDEVDGAAINSPTVVRFAPDGRVFVAEKRGRVAVASGLGQELHYALDIRTRVNSYWDRGLLGMVLDPDFDDNGELYVAYTYDHILGDAGPAGKWLDGCPNPPGGTTDGCVVSARISKFEMTGPTSFGPEQVLVEDWCMQFPSHSIGDLEFGPDGFLYASGGDGASFFDADYGQFGGSSGSPTPENPCGDPPGGSGTANTSPSGRGGALRSQSLRRPSGEPISLDGAIIRINPDTGAAAAGNPLAGNANTNARRIVAYGFRNPFRFTFRPGTGELWIGDVGWNDTEEINRLTDPVSSPVENFGWPCYEGTAETDGYDSLTLCQNLYDDGSAPLRQPVFSYAHGGSVVAGDGCPTPASAVISGVAFYDGGAYPARFDDALFFTDHSRNCIWAMRATGGIPDPAKVEVVVRSAGNPVDLMAGPAGDIFYVDHEGGLIHRLTFASGNTPPVARIDATPTSGDAPLEVDFDGRDSSDADPGDTLTYAWDFTDNGSVDATSATPTHTYTNAGVFTARLTVTDSEGATGTTTQQIIADGSGAIINGPASSRTWAVGDNIAFSGSATDSDGDPIPASALTWTLTILHCATVNSCHTHVVETREGVASGTFVAPDHEYPSSLIIQLTADHDGISNIATVQLAPKHVDLKFRTEPNLLDFSINGATYHGIVGTPAVMRTFIVGSRISLVVPDEQDRDHIEYGFDEWSDGSSKETRTVTAPSKSWSSPLRAIYDPKSADLSVTQKGDLSSSGKSIAWKVVAHNADGGKKAHDVKVRVNLPSKLAAPDFDAPGWHCKFKPNLRRIVCERSTLTAGTDSKIRFTTRIRHDGAQATNLAWITSSTRDVHSVNDQVTTVVILD